VDRIFSTRLDEDLIRQIDRFARERSMSKKNLIEKAVRKYMKDSGEKLEHVILDRSFGAWKREAGPEEIWAEGRRAFNESFGRHSKKSVGKNESVRR